MIRKIKDILDYMIGERFCRYFHKPLLFQWTGCGGRDVFGRRRKSYYEYQCAFCNRSWESVREPKWNKLPQEERYIIGEKIKEQERKDNSND